MNEKFRQRLLGLIVVLALLFALTWLLPRQAGNGDGAVPSTVVPLASLSTGASSGGSAADTLGDAEGAPQLPPDERSPPGESAQTTAAPADAQAPTPTPSERAAVKPAAATAAPSKAKPPAPPVVAKADKPATLPTVKADKPETAPKIASTTPSNASTPAPASSPPPPPPLSAAVAKAAAAAPDAKVWYVQIGSFADQGNAQTTLSLLQNVGYRGEAAAAQGPNGNTLYRVRLGPFPTEALARAAQDKVAHQGYPQSRAVSEPTRVR
ncbi:MAG: hypothetical protein JWR16_915 [Nevskia sp.]|nr:hypothetical protein [Nevskia sp.]